MPREAPVHLTAMAVLIGSTAWLLYMIGPALPPVRVAVTLALATTYVTVWLCLISLRLRPRDRWPKVSQPWRRQDRTIVWMGNAVLISGFWLCMPYADESLRLLALMFSCATVTAEMMGTIVLPPNRPPLAYAPLALPLSSAAYYALHWDHYSAAVILFMVAYALVVQQLGRILQWAMDRAYSDRQAAETALAAAAAERDAKTRFLASASHDLGQPLQAARLFFDQTMRSHGAAQREKAAGKVAWAFDTTEQILRQILDHLRLDSGAIEARIEFVAVGPLIARVAEMNEPAARLAGVSLLALPSHLQAAADTGLAERALSNLVANSIRHAKARRVLVGARRVGGRVRLWVIDDGVGVAEADAPRLFDDYVQGSDHGDEIRGGFGLGLASARRMAGLMGGAVGLDANWCGGSAFWLELNAAEAKTP